MAIIKDAKNINIQVANHYNSCAGKVSMTLSLSGCPIVKMGGVGSDFRGTEGQMKDKAFISTASKGESGKWAFGGHHYETYAKAMYFWELK